jgi:hypothetical protein
MVIPGVAASVFAQVIDFDVVKSKSPSHGNFGLLLFAYRNEQTDFLFFFFSITAIPDPVVPAEGAEDL